ncbi:4Fe-4S binding protein [Fusibacter sp. 3D3]|uniref:nucleotide-binding protein n=1 Tax=Fusibacter sp. 3D3 TaxID=1048380 RepID=UPI0008537B13|nr:ATP-binding protein [Fusibacter sp. 3D3]GAU76507.1 MinD superfamily P-loop ATPase containing an inserted ferredoxin domain [Fusibacter sp. 3D3]
MKIAVLSGKGGTGKTLVSVNLASVFERSVYIDCDVEEPNGHLFFKPEDRVTKEILVKIPVVDYDKCIGCRACVEFCKFNALAFINQKVKVFDSICHSCGGCSLICPEHAIKEKDKVIGVIESGQSNNVKVMTGRLNTGEETGIPIIKELLNLNKWDAVSTVIDCPPGSSCMVMESIKDADYCVLIAEPTLFGSHNLSMVYELVKLFNKPFGCVLNKCIEGENPSEDFCASNNIPIIGRIPFDKNLGAINSNGTIVTRVSAEYSDLFKVILNKIEKEVSR